MFENLKPKNFTHHDRETPDVAHTNRRTDTCQNETPLTLETISLF